ncbi:trimethylamine methyltransferase family protein [Desulfosporosinus orientis]|uniref:trimethylamine methyltransferase family protein n=1 Tax=Desulfosporosinus orientis TaxID=1563 RepID=UPI00249E0765|nr:trimethylamine methyltransferase family protein [Desulfosporosinus orientis]
MAMLPVSPLSPLEYGYDPAEALLDIVEAGLPLGVEPCPMMGSTGPMTMAGIAVQHNSEILAGVIASQMIRPGSPVTMSSRATFMDYAFWGRLMGYAGNGLSGSCYESTCPVLWGSHCSRRILWGLENCRCPERV